jgi:hypothetical protein
VTIYPLSLSLRVVELENALCNQDKLLFKFFRENKKLNLELESAFSKIASLRSAHDDMSAQFESRSSDGILLGYTPHGRSYRVFNLETNTIVESCDVTFDEIAPCLRDVFECAGDKEMEEGIFVDEGLQGVDGDEDDPLLSSISSPELVPASTLEAEAPQATTSSTAAVEVSRVEGDIISESGAPSHIQKAYPPQQIIGNLNERITRSSRLAHLSCFTNTLFVALFEP